MKVDFLKRSQSSEQSKYTLVEKVDTEGYEWIEKEYAVSLVPDEKKAPLS